MGIYKSGRPEKYNPGCNTGHIPPKKPGEYRIRNEAGNIAYIGETNNLNRRMHEHMRTGKLPSGTGSRSTIEFKVADGRSSSVTRRQHECAKIAQHKPFLNKSTGGEGRIAKK